MLSYRNSSRRNFLKAGVGAATLLNPAWQRAFADAVDPRVAQVMSRTISIDMHNHVYPNGIPSRQGGGPPGFMGGLFGQPQRAEPRDLVLADQLKRAGLTAVCAAYELDFTPISNPGDARNNYLRWIDALDKQLQQEQLHRAFHLKDL